MATWILVSDTSRAKLFSTEKREDDWRLLKEFEHPEGRKLSKDISPSAPPGRHAAEQRIRGTSNLDGTPYLAQGGVGRTICRAACPLSG